MSVDGTVALEKEVWRDHEVHVWVAARRGLRAWDAQFGSEFLGGDYWRCSGFLGGSLLEWQSVETIIGCWFYRSEK
ncbi:hypothetical protein LIA77_01367 [Sarocladium implicatum]|nr:hypothetical protein LIA77_01367 [Sarocladium implicatum]